MQTLRVRSAGFSPLGRWMRAHQRVAWVLVPALLAVLACGPSQQSVAPTGTQPATGPKTGGTFNQSVSQDPFNWDTTASRTTPNSTGAVMAYDTLLTYKTGPDIDYNQGVLAPRLAERWEVSPDAKAYTFRLRQGVKFAPAPPMNGRELTSSDVRWSYEYASRSGAFKDKGLPPGEFDFFFEGIDRIETPDKYTAVVHFKAAFTPFPSYAGADWNVIMPPEVHAMEGSLQDNIVGTGPYQLDRNASQKGTRWVWTRNPNYWEPGKPYLDQVRWLVIKEDAPMYAAFQTKQIDILETMGAAPSEEIKRANPGAGALEYQTGYPLLVHLNHRKPPLNDARIRRALALSIDRDELIKVLEKGKGAWQMPAVFTGYFTQEEARRLQPYNPEQAKRLVVEAGYPDGVPVEIQYPGQTEGQEFITLLELLQSQVKKGGINLELKNVERNTYTRNLRAPYNFQFIIRGGASQRWDADTSLAYFDPKVEKNFSGTDDPVLTQMVEAQRRESDPAKRREIIRRASTHIVEQGHSIGFYSKALHEFWQPYVKDHFPNWNVRTKLESIWIDK